MQYKTLLFCALALGGADVQAEHVAVRRRHVSVAAAQVCMQEGADEAAAPAQEEMRRQPRGSEFGLHGNGRAIGGLAAIPLFEWWPIKAYRPCPKCAEAGIRYSRTGQSLDEIVFKKNPKGGYYGDD